MSISIWKRSSGIWKRSSGINLSMLSSLVIRRIDVKWCWMILNDAECCSISWMLLTGYKMRYKNDYLAKHYKLKYSSPKTILCKRNLHVFRVKDKSTACVAWTEGSSSSLAGKTYKFSLCTMHITKTNKQN
jgi:hypothetical protein